MSIRSFHILKVPYNMTAREETPQTPRQLEMSPDIEMPTPKAPTESRELPIGESLERTDTERCKDEFRDD